MDNREWMYTGRPSQDEITPEWMDKTEGFLNQAFGKAANGARDTFYPCSECGNRKRKTRKIMGEHLFKYGFTPNYTRWVFHGEAHHTREEVVRPRVKAFDDDAGVPDLLDDVHQALGVDECEKEEMEAATKAFYEMMNSA